MLPVGEPHRDAEIAAERLGRRQVLHARLARRVGHDARRGALDHPPAVGLVERDRRSLTEAERPAVAFEVVDLLGAFTELGEVGDVHAELLPRFAEQSSDMGLGGLDHGEACKRSPDRRDTR